MKNSISLFLILLLTISIQAQNTLSPDLNSVVAVPQSPEAAAFERYGNVPVSMYTGTPQISVPLFNIQGREMSMPASLSYDASGVKVDQMATWIGLGWNLNVGGAVTRQVAGLPDGYPTTASGFIGKRVFDPLVTEFLEYCSLRDVSVGSTHPRGVFRLWDELQNNQQTLNADLEPDLFSFNVNGLSGTIFINYAEDTAYCQNDPNIRVEFNFDSTDPLVKEQLSSWTITGPDGTKYIFAAKEVTSHELEIVLENNIHNSIQEYTSAWYLSQVISPSKKDLIQFSYVTENDWVNSQRILYGTKSITNPINSSSLEGVCGLNSTGSEQGATINEYNIKQLTLSGITVNGRLAAGFEKGSSERKDLKGRYPLSKIKVYNQIGGGSIANEIDLIQSYFGNPADLNFTGTHSEERIRLKLDTVKFLGAENSGVQAQKYFFDYHDPTLLPYRDDKGVDYWGYYNGVNNSDLVPAYDDGNGTVLAGANRNPVLSTTLIGTLKKIHYPTGGHSEFYYGLHSAPPTSNTYFEEETESLLQVQGGEDLANPYNYCDDSFTNTQTPEGGDAAFTFYSTDISAKVRLQLFGSPDPTISTGQNVIIYKSGNGCPSPGATLCNYNTALSFCDLFINSPPEIVYFGDPFGGPSTFLEVNLPDVGGYRIQILNSDANVTVDAKLIRTVEKQETIPQTIGGLRVYKTIDRKEDGGADELTKFYYYGDFHSDFASLGDYTSVSTTSFSSSYSSSAVIHAPLRFHTITESHDCDGTPGSMTPDYTCTSLTRYSSNLRRSIGAHIAYSTVSEVSYSDVEGYNGFSIYSYYNEQETIDQIPFAKRKLANGEVQRSRMFDRDGNILEESLNYFTLSSVPGIASTRGFVSSSTESQVGFRYLIEESTGNGTISDNVELNYVEYCDRTDGLWVPQTPPCGGPILTNQTIWINRPGQSYQFNSSSNDPREYVLAEAWSGGPIVPRDGGGSEFCPTGGCVQGVDYKFADLQVAQNTNEPIEWCGTSEPQPYFLIKTYVHSAFWLRLDSTVTIRYENGNSLSVLSENFYDRAPDGTQGHYQLTGTKTTNSDGNVYTTKTIYPDDIDLDPNTAGYQNLSLFLPAEKTAIRLLGCHELHRITTPILQESYVNGVASFLQKNTFIDHANSPLGGEIVLPELIKTSKGGTSQADLKIVIQYHEYDAIGNPLEISRGQGGAPISFRWGHNNTYVIERIDNATIGAVNNSLGGTYTDIREDPNLGPDVMVTSYDYEYSYGRVSSITDPNGRATTFSYDGFGRLTKVLDHKGNLRSLTEYNLGN